MAKITIKSPVSSITRDKRDGSGTYTKHTQEATFETSAMRVNIELEVKDANSAHAQGVYDFDIEEALVMGRFGPELPRFWKLTPAKTKAAA
ncbi:hypothetical protein [Arenimonas oryziterrae]|uniref:Uncharacterized protein n=1 Tax=Arenimonas oryziterrae DSM 21050 = YC6267 TaxID=1121015 RepID=A0A091APP2_9GAMM|nr:hypothetical protein [Arenimonas oryziterrae]KFN42143.1 hypothetical protein N789_14670 [Arenimonas oryziterrae DSM 21050 = YC6267]